MIVPGLVSTITPVYNRPDLVKDAVACVLAQTYRPIELLLIDDGSTDDTPAVCMELARAHPDIIRYQRQPNGGPGRARETGRQAARGEFIQYLDSDDYLAPRKFETQVQALRNRPECGIAYCFTRYTEVGSPAGTQPWKQTGITVEYMFPKFLVERWWDTSTPLYRRELLDRAGPWTELRLNEDWEYDCRVAALGPRLTHCREFLSETRAHCAYRLSQGGALDPTRLRARAVAHQLIHGHARRAGIGPEDPFMQHFARAVFLLARQCGAGGLATEARQLFEVARAAAGTRGSGLDYRLYRSAAGLMGWCNAGRLACWLDRFRARPTRELKTGQAELPQRTGVLQEGL